MSLSMCTYSNSIAMYLNVFAKRISLNKVKLLAVPNNCQCFSFPSIPLRLEKYCLNVSITIFPFIERDRVTLPGLLEHLNDVVHWDKFGAYLLPTEYSVEIQSIRKTYKGDVDECKMALFQKYMEVGDRSWTTVITALKKSGYKNIAKDTARSLGL